MRGNGVIVVSRVQNKGLFPVVLHLMEDGVSPGCSFYGFDVFDGLAAFMCDHGYNDILKSIAIFQYPVPVDPPMADVLDIITQNKPVYGLNKLELPNVRKEIGLHDRYLHDLIVLCPIQYPDYKIYLFS